MTSHRTFSAQADCWSSERGDWLPVVHWGASFLFFPSSFSPFLLFSSLKTLLLHSLPHSLSPKLALKRLSCHSHAPSILPRKHKKDPRNSTTKYSIQTNLSASILQTSTQYKPQETNENTKTKCKPK